MVKVKREYYPAKFRLDNCDRYVLWSRDLEANFDNDQVWIENQRAPTFKNLDEIKGYATQIDIDLVDEGEPFSHDLEYIQHWLHLKKMKRTTQFYPGEILSAWNIFGDLARALRLPFRGDADELTALWTKLLFGDEHRRVTRWSGCELQTTHEVLTHGLAMWRGHVRK